MPDDWQSWLQTWNRELLARYDPAEHNAFVDQRVTPDVIASGWLGSPGASEAHVAELETRLGARLPPSYRDFLGASNGFLQPGVIVPRLLPAGEVAWLRERDPETIEAWTEFEQYLGDTLQVSERETIGTAMYLLNPRVVSADGEWEAFYFAHWVPGVNKFPSFRALMQSELETLRAPAPPPPHGRLRTLIDAIRWIFRPPRRE
jgi:hypothetical protein